MLTVWPSSINALASLSLKLASPPRRGCAGPMMLMRNGLCDGVMARQLIACSSEFPLFDQVTVPFRGITRDQFTDETRQE